MNDIARYVNLDECVYLLPDAMMPLNCAIAMILAVVADSGRDGIRNTYHMLIFRCSVASNFFFNESSLLN